jgi:hypothetical protein
MANYESKRRLSESLSSTTGHSLKKDYGFLVEERRWNNEARREKVGSERAS